MDRSDWLKRMRSALVVGVCALSLGGRTLALPPDVSETAASGADRFVASPLVPVVQSTQAGQALTGTTFRVLRSWSAKLSDHSVIYNQVEAPPVSTPAPTPAVAPRQTPYPAYQKAQRMVSLSATVYDQRITDLRWSNGKRQIRVFTNIDFRYFCSVGQIETAAIDYDLTFGLGTATSDADDLDAATRAWLARARQQLPDLTLAPTTPASYLIAEGTGADDPGGFAALDAIHAYFNAHRTEMVQAYRLQTAEDAAHQLYLRLHPPVVKDTVINFWPKRGIIHLNQGN